jgi:hypothetical protein
LRPAPRELELAILTALAIKILRQDAGILVMAALALTLILKVAPAIHPFPERVFSPQTGRYPGGHAPPRAQSNHGR